MNILKKLFGRKKPALAESQKEIPEKLRANTDLAKFCYEQGVELSSHNNQGKYLNAITGQVVYRYLPTHQEFKEIEISANVSQEISKTYASHYGEFQYDSYLTHRANEFSKISYFYLRGKYTGVCGTPFVCMGGSRLESNLKESLPQEVFEKGKAAIVALEALLGRTLIERPSVKREIK